MNKKLITMLVTFCFMLLLAPVSVMAATPTNAPIVIDVGGANVENENYKITDTGINIRKRDVNYERAFPARIVESVLMKSNREAFPLTIRLEPARNVLDWVTRWNLMKN